MEIIVPNLGLIVWTLVVFLIIVFILSKFAWKPIMKAISKREESIENALSEAKRAREEMAQLSADNERLLQEARKERDDILKEAKEMKESIIAEAKASASSEASNMIEKARQEIENEKRAALAE